MLSGASDASAAVFDVQHATTDFDGGGGLIAKHKSLFSIDKQHQNGHKFTISSAIWYPIDTGLFITGSYDHYIKVWDTNTTQVCLSSLSNICVVIDWDFGVVLVPVILRCCCYRWL